MSQRSKKLRSLKQLRQLWYCRLFCTHLVLDSFKSCFQQQALPNCLYSNQQCQLHSIVSRVPTSYLQCQIVLKVEGPRLLNRIRQFQRPLMKLHPNNQARSCTELALVYREEDEFIMIDQPTQILNCEIFSIFQNLNLDLGASNRPLPQFR